jgi:sugar lactone lactonase YvrE
MRASVKYLFRTATTSLVPVVCVAIVMLPVTSHAQNLFVGCLGTGQSIVELSPDGTQSIFATGLTDARALAFDSSGNLFAADYPNGNIYKFTPDGTRTTFASGLIYPGALAFNSTGDLFVASGQNLFVNISELSPDGVQISVTSWKIATIKALAFDATGDLFVGELGGPNNIVKITPDGVQSTFVSLLQSAAFAFDNAGNLYVGTFDGRVGGPVTNSIIKITADGTQSTFATGLGQIGGLAFNSAGNLFEADSLSGNIFEFTPDGQQTLFASGLTDPIGLAFQPVPEPSVFGLLVVGILMFLFRYRCLVLL